MTENMLNRKLLTNLKHLLVHCVRIENAVSSGLPDINCCSSAGVEFWIESKIVREQRISFRNSQVAWITVRSGFGGRCWIFAANGSTLLVYHGNQVFDLAVNKNGYIRELKPYAVFERPWKYVEIIRLCTTAPFIPKPMEMISNTY